MNVHRTIGNLTNSHEVLDNTVEFGALVAETKIFTSLALAGCKGTEVLSSFWNSL